MCGRFTLRTPASVLIQQFGLPPDDGFFGPWLPRYNIAPTQDILAVRRTPDQDGRQAAMLRWGLIPSWAKDPAIGNRMINARSETVASKPSFWAAFRQRRCLIVADGYYEWQKTGSAKQPYYFHRPDGQPFALAGLWETWRGQRDDQDVLIESCTIITTAPNALASDIHDRMPAILLEQEYDNWLDPAGDDRDRLQSLLRPAADDLLAADAVSTYVNRPINDGPGCVEPI